MTTITKALERLEVNQREDERRRDILTALPSDLPAPSISNIKDGSAWLSWGGFDSAEPPGSDVLRSLERAGFQPQPASLARYGSWRSAPMYGFQEELPNERHGDELTDSSPIAPLWLRMNQHTEEGACAYYWRSGTTYRVKVPGPKTFGVTADRQNHPGGWSFKRGSARLRLPDGLHAALSSLDLGVHALSGARVDTDQGISGDLYAECWTEALLHPSVILRALEAL